MAPNSACINILLCGLIRFQKTALHGDLLISGSEIPLQAAVKSRAPVHSFLNCSWLYAMQLPVNRVHDFNIHFSW